MPLYCGIGGVKHKISGLYTGVGGVKKELTEMWAAENGVKKLVYKAISYDPVLNNNNWDLIRQASDKGVASSVWSVGDRKAVTLNGTWSKLTFSNCTYYVYILGFNHNSPREGRASIHFQFGYTKLSGGVHIAFISGYRDDSDFYMNASSTNSGGWKNSFMRNTVCTTFKNCLPSALRSVLKSITKYSDNTGRRSNVESTVTMTTDTIFLLSEFEVFGDIQDSNKYEQNYQEQYQYYKNGNSKLRYDSSSESDDIPWWLRSPGISSTGVFCGVSKSGTSFSPGSQYSMGFAPAFCV